MKVAFLKTNNNLVDNGYSEEEQEQLYDLQLQELFENPRWYLDNLDYMPVYRVSWNDYSLNTATLPLKHVNRRNVFK
jgi:hypothetical protein